MPMNTTGFIKGRKLPAPRPFSPSNILRPVLIIHRIKYFRPVNSGKENKDRRRSGKAVFMKNDSSLHSFS